MTDKERQANRQWEKTRRDSRERGNQSDAVAAAVRAPVLSLSFHVFTFPDLLFFPSMGFSLIHMDQPRKSNEIHMYCVHLKQLISKVPNGVTAATTAPYGSFEATIGHLISLIQ